MSELVEINAFPVISEALNLTISREACPQTPLGKPLLSYHQGQ